MTKPRGKDGERRRRVAQILALALVWGVGVLALVFERGASRRPATTRPAPVVAAAAPEIAVDVGNLFLSACTIQAVSFRTRNEGWVTDACGHAFHTTDGGVSFEELEPGEASLALNSGNITGNVGIGDVTRMEWLSDQRGIAFANGVRDYETLVMITSDGGATWRRRRLPVPDGERFYASAHADQTVWVCGATGAIMRSRDGGAHFARTSRTPFNGDDRCTALSFIDADSGWAGGMDGTLYQTADGGDSWKRMEPPRRARPTGKTTISDRAVYDLRVAGIAHVTRETRDTTWVAMQQESPDTGTWTYVTDDGGRTWWQSTAPPAIAARLWRGSAWGDAAVVVARDERLAFYSAAGYLSRITPLVSAGPSAREIIRGREPLGPGHIGAWTDHAVIDSFDDARTWSTTARVGLDKRIRRVVHVDRESGGFSRRALIELADGSILTGWDGEPSASAQPEFDRFVMDMTDAHRRGAPTPPGPLTCMATAPTGRLIVRFGTLACDESKELTFRMAWSDGHATMSIDEWSKHDSAPDLLLTAAERAKLLSAIADAVQRPDDGRHGCTSSLDAKLEWICGTAPPVSASFDESNCGESDTGPAHRLAGIIQYAVLGSLEIPR